jgi:CheY-like chemotaxis protein
MTSVLVADDTPGVRQLIRLILQPEHQVIEAGDGAQALRRLIQIRPQIAILDVGMPELSGLDLCRMIRQDHRLASTIVIIMTANGTPTDRDAAIAAGADGFIAKPFSPSAMLLFVKEILLGRTALPG